VRERKKDEVGENVILMRFIIYNNDNIYLTAIGLSPGGSGFKHIYKYLTLCY
jgi:hypothetical protein